MGWRLTQARLPRLNLIKPLAGRACLSLAFVSLFRCPQEGTRPKEMLLELGLGSAARQDSSLRKPRATCSSPRSPPSLLSAPRARSTFCELKDWVQ